MKLLPAYLTLLLLLTVATAARAGDAGVATCGPNDVYVTLYRSLDTFEMQARLPCGAKLELLEQEKGYAEQHTPYIRIRTVEGTEGYIARTAVVILRGEARQNESATAKPVAASPAKHRAETQTLIAGEVKIPDGTELEVALSTEISSERVAPGTLVELAVAQPVVIDGATIFERGAQARARITGVKKAARWGHNGEISWTMLDVTAVDGDRIPARFIQESQNTPVDGKAAGFVVATGNILLVEPRSSFGVNKGDPAFMPAGQLFKVLVHGETVVGPPHPRTLESPALSTTARPAPE
ncbi:MAG TPA: hypothetical protein VN044_05440 [Verrucomicrobiae bacterium]|jgi:hypothetical protein|nr:hypothetical protein [Verrucomicrobiae bacterium]